LLFEMIAPAKPGHGEGGQRWKGKHQKNLARTVTQRPDEKACRSSEKPSITQPCLKV
jgi:hypothetical protein